MTKTWKQSSLRVGPQSCKISLTARPLNKSVTNLRRYSLKRRTRHLTTKRSFYWTWNKALNKSDKLWTKCSKARGHKIQPTSKTRWSWLRLTGRQKWHVQILRLSFKLKKSTNPRWTTWTNSSIYSNVINKGRKSRFRSRFSCKKHELSL